MRLALIGPRGSGKTTVARLLARRLKYPVASMDKMIESEAGRSVDAIVKAGGWKDFRDKETQCLRRIVNDNTGDLIIDCGGGVIESAVNREYLKQIDRVVFLSGQADELVKRLRGEMDDRPQLTQSADELEEMKQVLAARLTLYRQAADLEVDVANLSPDDIATRIIQSLNFAKRMK